MLELAIPLLLNGIFYAGILFLLSAGLQIIFGVLRIVNFAHAAAYILGTYFTYAIIKALPPEASFLYWIAPLIAAALVGVLGLAFERGLLKHIYHRHHAFQILVTAGIAYMVDDVVRWKWGGYSIGTGPIVEGSVELGGVVYPVYNLLIILVALSVAFLLWLLYDSTVHEWDPWFAFVVGFVLLLAVTVSLIPALRAKSLSPGHYPEDE